MVETVSGPSELHLKKELTALRKARVLRDPETCSSWRSPFSSKSFYESGTRGDRQGVTNFDESCEVPQGFEKRRKKVYLYNWVHPSRKSSDSGTRSDQENRQESIQGNSEEHLSHPLKIDPKSDTYLDYLETVYGARGINTETSGRTTRKSRRSAVSKKRVMKNSVISKMLDLPSSSLGLLNSLEQSDDIEYSNSEDLQQATHYLTQKNGYASRCASPLFSGTRHRNVSRSKVLKNARREGSSYSHTPASNSSCNRYGGWNPSTVGSWDGTTSFDGDEVDQLELGRRQGCDIPCYGSKRMKDRGCGGYFSPSLSDTLRRKGCGIFCGSRTLYNKRRSSGSHKQNYLAKSSQDLPLLTNSCDGGGSSVGTATDELSTNFAEFDLEALSRLDGMRWSSCRSQEGLELALPGGASDSEMPKQRSLSQKYRPRSFDEIIGQNIVLQSLNNAVLRGRIAPAYIFQGPRGTGKTSTARIFTAALNCLSTEEKKPCGFCSECNGFTTGNGSNMREVDATNNKDLGRLRLLMKRLSVSTTFSRYIVFVIDECHMLSSKSWSRFTKFLEEPLSHVVFIFITTDPDKLPRTIVSRCQKYIFHKIKDADIICRLRKLSAEENLDIELDALDLISLNSYGSLRDAETMLDQLSLLGKRITTSLVNDLVGVVSDEKLLDLLEIALSSNTSETVKKSRELMDSGVDPVALMSQLAGLIMDIIAGSYHLGKSQCSRRILSGESLTETELERLQQALRILSDSEKQLRLSSERSTWFTAALLQLASAPNQEHTLSSSSKQSNTKTNASAFDMVKETSVCKGSNPSLTPQESSSSSIPKITSGHYSPHECPSYSMSIRENLICESMPTNSISIDRNLLDATEKDDATSNRLTRCVSQDKLDEIWRRCIRRCHSMPLRQLLSAHGKLVSIAKTEGVLIAYIAFGDGNIKSSAERFLSSITNSIERVLRHNVEVRIGLVPENCLKPPKSVPDSSLSKHMDKVECDESNGSNKDRHMANPQLPWKSVDYPEVMLQRTLDKCDSSPVADKGFQVATSPNYSSKGNNGACGTKERRHEISEQITQTRAIDEQRLENAWVQATEKVATGSASHSKPEKLFLSQNPVNSKNQNEPSIVISISSKHQKDELNHEIEELGIDDGQGHYKEQVGGRADQYYYAISPSLLHSNSFRANFDKDKPGKESGPGCGFCCWKRPKVDRANV